MSTVNFTNEQLAIFIKNGNNEYIPELWENCCRLLFKLSHSFYCQDKDRFESCGITPEDMKQECYFIFMRMIEAYDPEKEYLFLTYANYQIKYHLRLILRKGNYADEPLNNCKLLSEPVSEEDEKITLGDSLRDEAAELDILNVDELVYTQQLRHALNQEMNEALTEKEKQLIFLRYYANATYKEIGKAERVSINAVQQRERYALRKLKRHNYATKRLDSFRREITQPRLYRSTGIGSFKNQRASSVELAVEKSVFVV